MLFSLTISKLYYKPGPIFSHSQIFEDIAKLTRARCFQKLFGTWNTNVKMKIYIIISMKMYEYHIYMCACILNNKYHYHSLFVIYSYVHIHNSYSFIIHHSSFIFIFITHKLESSIPNPFNATKSRVWCAAITAKYIHIHAHAAAHSISPQGSM